MGLPCVILFHALSLYERYTRQRSRGTSSYATLLVSGYGRNPVHSAQ